MQACLRLDDCLPFVGLELGFSAKSFLHFCKLEEDELIVGVAVSVVGDKELESFILST